MAQLCKGEPSVSARVDSLEQRVDVHIAVQQRGVDAPKQRLLPLAARGRGRRARAAPATAVGTVVRAELAKVLPFVHALVHLALDARALRVELAHGGGALLQEGRHEVHRGERRTLAPRELLATMDLVLVLVKQRPSQRVLPRVVKVGQTAGGCVGRGAAVESGAVGRRRRRRRLARLDAEVAPQVVPRGRDRGEDAAALRVLLVRVRGLEPCPALSRVPQRPMRVA